MVALGAVLVIATAATAGFGVGIILGLLFIAAGARPASGCCGGGPR